MPSNEILRFFWRLNRPITFFINLSFNISYYNISVFRFVHFLKGQQAIHLAAQHGHCDVVALLLSRNQDQISMKDSLLGLTPLHLACMFNQAAMVQLLLSQGAEVNVSDKVYIAR